MFFNFHNYGQILASLDMPEKAPQSPPPKKKKKEKKYHFLPFLCYKFLPLICTSDQSCLDCLFECFTSVSRKEHLNLNLTHATRIGEKSWKENIRCTWKGRMRYKFPTAFFMFTIFLKKISFLNEILRHN